MSVIKLKQVVADLYPEWQTPYPGDRWTESRRLTDGRVVEVECRRWSPHAAYAIVGEPHPILFPHIDNTRLPSDAVYNVQLSHLHDLSKECDVILWQHAHACYPSVAQHLKTLFKQSLLYFGDDCPGSSETKTFPIARYFDALLYSMWVRSENGEKTAAKYAEHGLARSYWYPMTTSAGVAEWIRDAGFIVDDRVRPIDLVWVGQAGYTQRRWEITRRMEDARGISPNQRWELRGFRMSGGDLEGREQPKPGSACASMYSYSLSGANVAESSIFNCRLQDLWECGVIQIVNDAHGELPQFGFVDGEHYLSWDGSAQHLVARVDWCRSNPAAVSKMRQAAFQQRRVFASKHNRDAALVQAYEDFLK